MNPLTRVLATQAPVRHARNFQHLELDASAARMAHALSLTNHEEWLSAAVPPFERCTITFNPAAFIDGADAHVVAVIDEGRVRTYLVAENTVMPTPFDIRLHEELAEDAIGPGEREADDAQMTVLAWGTTYARDHGMPASPAVRVLKELPYTRAPRNATFQCAFECAGQLRVLLAMFALLNAERPAGVDPDTQREGRAILGGLSVPKYKPRVVVLRPDAPRRVTSSVHEWSSGIKKREHEVRRHLRRYKSGKTVWVREHVRGDAALGRVEKQYLVEADPNKDLNHD